MAFDHSAEAPAHPGAAAFTLGHGSVRVAMFHGLTGTPAELWPLGLGLAAAGYRVEAPRWEGHGTSPQDLVRATADDLIHHARQLADGPEVFIGLSMGALLAIIAAAESRTVRALVLLAPAVTLIGANGVFQALRHFPRAGSGLMLPKLRAKQLEEAATPLPAALSPELQAVGEAAIQASTVQFDGRYTQIPIGWSREFASILREAKRVAWQVTVPTLLLHGGQDTTAAIDGSLEVARWLGGETRLRVFPRSPHVMPLGPDRGVLAVEVVEFLRRHGS